MIVAIMQPYFFPYIGYFQLMQKADIFVFYDDAQYMKGGWVNRNRILTNDRPHWFTLPVQKANHSLAINQRSYAIQSDTIPGLKRRLAASYAKAPHYDRISTLIHRLLECGDANVASFNANLLHAVAVDMGIDCRFAAASTLDVPELAAGQNKVIALCQAVRATEYVNPIGGQGLYSGAAFSDAGIRLGFLQSEPNPYRQLDATHVPALSIIDVLMFNSPPEVTAMLDQFRVVDPQSLAVT